jgi:carbon monoxide dehydrogenase subunit G
VFGRAGKPNLFELYYSATFSAEMQLENSFTVDASPDRVFAYLLDVNKVVGCVPGAELTEVVDTSTFKGKVKVKVGPITVAYSGTARIAERDDAGRMATLEAEGRETTGPGSARAKARMKVAADGSGSLVTVTTDYSVAGRVAQFGRGVMEDVSRRIVNDMAACIKANVEGGHDMPPTAAAEGGEPAPAPATAPVTAKPVNALTMFFQVLWAGIRRLFGAKT